MVKNPKLLRRAYDTWLAAESLRARRDRHKRYTYGDQWCDIIKDHNGKQMREHDLILRAGRRPLTNNLIRQLVKTIVGRFRALAADNHAYSSELAIRNQLLELDCRLLEEFIISGCAIQRLVAERRGPGIGVWVDNVSPTHFFVNHFTDPRGMDIDFIGMLHDWSDAEIINRFGGNRHRVDNLRALLSNDINDNFLGLSDAIGFAVAGTDFFRPAPGRHRVIEIWRLRSVERTMGSRVSMDVHWHCSFLAPDGTVLADYDSPFKHGGHPFVLNFYPLTDGEVHSFVEDVIDQQRTINRLVVILDSMMSTSAKGALLYPLKQLPAGWDISQIGELWARSDSVIPITDIGNMPQQVITNTADSGASQLLNLQLKLFEDVSGINDALLGRNISSSTGAEFYRQQTQNAAVALADLLETFSSFTNARNALAASF